MKRLSTSRLKNGHGATVSPPDGLNFPGLIRTAGTIPAGMSLLMSVLSSVLLSVLIPGALFAEGVNSASEKQTPPPFPLAVEGGVLPVLDASPGREEILRSIGRGVNFLIERQNKNGSWGSAHRSKGLDLYAPGSSHAAFRAGTSSLALSALIEVRAASLRDDEPLDLVGMGIEPGKIDNAIERGEWWLLEMLPDLRRSSVDCLYNVWGHAYGIECLGRMLEHRPGDGERTARIRDLIVRQVEMLRKCETIYGGWFYYDDGGFARPAETTACFVSATGLLALKKAEDHGIEIPRKMVDTTVASIIRQRNPDFSYLYGEYLKSQPRMPINRPAGSLGRSQACNLALRKWGGHGVTEEIMENWLKRFFGRNGWLDIGRKRPIPHESWFSIAGYFFYYGQYHAALCIEELPESKRNIYRPYLAETLVRLQEQDGSWWDFPLYDYHQQYGTAFAVLSLLKTIPRPQSE